MINNNDDHKLELSLESAETVMELIYYSWSKGWWPDGTDNLMRYIELQYPDLAKKYNYLPWPK